MPSNNCFVSGEYAESSPTVIPTANLNIGESNVSGANCCKNGTKTSRITLCSVSGLPAYLNLRKQRFLCRECGSSFTADTSRIVENKRY